MSFTFLLTAFVLAVLMAGLFFVIQGINQKKWGKVTLVIILLVVFVIAMYLILTQIITSM